MLASGVKHSALAIRRHDKKLGTTVGSLHGALFGWIDDLLTTRNFGRALSFFIASFSQNPDDLHQWRSYADDGRGVAIGFSAKLFQPLESKHVDPRRNTFAGALMDRRDFGTWWDLIRPMQSSKLL
jgi:hypothetical protein